MACFHGIMCYYLEHWPDWVVQVLALWSRTTLADGTRYHINRPNRKNKTLLEAFDRRYAIQLRVNQGRLATPLFADRRRHFSCVRATIGRLHEEEMLS